VLISLGMGFLFAASWEEVAGLFGAFSSLVLVLVVAFILSAFLIHKMRQQKRARAAEDATPEKNETDGVTEMPPLLQGMPERKTGHLPVPD
jgi:predicted lipid-binding transport protein (Tim44 family)